MTTQEPTPTSEPSIFKIAAYAIGELTKQGMVSGKTEYKISVEPTAQMFRICKFGKDILVGFRTKLDKNDRDSKTGGLLVFDPTTSKIKQRIDTLAVDSCAVDENYLVAGGFGNGMIYVLKYEGGQFNMVGEKQLHSIGNFYYGVTVKSVSLKASIDKVISVSSSKYAIISNLQGDVQANITLPGDGFCVCIHNGMNIAFVGCNDGSIVTVDIMNANIKSTIKCPKNSGIRCFDICYKRNMLISGACSQADGWKIDESSSLTHVWTWAHKSGVHAVCLYSDRVIANVFCERTVALDVQTGELLKQYSNTLSGSDGIVVLEDATPVASTSSAVSATASALSTSSKTSSVNSTPAPASKLATTTASSSNMSKTPISNGASTPTAAAKLASPLSSASPSKPASASVKPVAVSASIAPSPSSDSSISPSSQGATSYASRLTAIEVTTESTLNPIFGLKLVALVSLADALDGLSTTDFPNLGTELKGAIFLAKKGCKNTPAPLTDDEAAAINIYTMETPLYGALNAALRNADRNAIKPFFKYLKLLLTALYKLPAETLNVYRGVKMSLPSNMQQGEEILWWSLTSTTSSVSVLSNPMFLGDKGNRVMFAISAKIAINIKKYSAIKGEDEYLLLPGTYLEVKGILPLGAGLHTVQLQQIDAPPFLDFVHPAMTK